MLPLKVIGIYILAALFEIAGCYGLYKSLKSDWSAAAGMVSVLVLGGFGVILTFATDVPGRAYAAYGGIYILMACVWMVTVDKAVLTLSDIAGVILAVSGCGIILTQIFERLKG